MDLQNTVQTTLNKMYDNVAVNKQGKAISINVKGYEFTLVDDGTMEEGKLAYLDIADGNIDLYSNGYKQYTGNLQNLNKNGATAYTGRYIITGTTTENVVRICDEGTYDITIKNLKIDFSDSSTFKCPFSTNEGKKATGCFVNLTLEENNYFQGKGKPGLSAGGGTPNVGNVTNGSSLTIYGNGSLHTSGLVNGSYGQPGIGGQTEPSGYVSNITINSGNIIAKVDAGHAAGIGGGLYQNVNNIIINDGNVQSYGSLYGAGIGACASTADNIMINGGIIYSKGMCGIEGSTKVTGGRITTEGSVYNIKEGIRGDKINITGGTIKSTSTKLSGISCSENGIINITGGSIFARGNNNIDIGTYSGSTLVAYTPTNSSSNLYETPIKLPDVGENKKITKLTTSDNIEYGIKDMCTLENGMLYLYLPTGTRTITITTEDGKAYSGTVETKETPEEIVLNEIN